MVLRNKFYWQTDHKYHNHTIATRTGTLPFTFLHFWNKFSLSFHKKNICLSITLCLFIHDPIVDHGKSSGLSRNLKGFEERSMVLKEFQGRFRQQIGMILWLNSIKELLRWSLGKCLLELCGFMVVQLVRSTIFLNVFGCATGHCMMIRCPVHGSNPWNWKIFRRITKECPEDSLGKVLEKYLAFSSVELLKDFLISFYSWIWINSFRRNYRAIRKGVIGKKSECFFYFLNISWGVIVKTRGQIFEEFL